jgi:thioredoxin 1
MKPILNHCLALLLSVTFLGAVPVTGWSQPPKSGGIAFSNSSWTAALKKAKAEHKLIFVDAYADWCGPCRQLKASTFVNPQVTAYFNTHFVNLAMNAEQGPGVAFATTWELESFPTLYFFTDEGKLIAKKEGFIPAKELLELARSIQPHPVSTGN